MKLALILSLAGAAASAAMAQTGSGGGIAGAIAGPAPASSVISSSGWAVSSNGMGMAGAVTGAPYSAEQISENVQTLADGTHITRPPNKTMFYRDSQGRTRIERIIPMPPGVPESAIVRPKIVEIDDPVSGTHYVLNDQSRTATNMFSSPPPQNRAGARPANLIPLTLPPVATAAPTAQARVQGAFISGPQSINFESSHESLGTQTIEGVLAEGTRTTLVYPVGSVGNDRPMSTFTETWRSQELKVIVLTKTSDPRNGEMTTRLTNISRAEPDATLFQVPPDYEIVEPK
jgi:hypothetical protein